MKRKGIREITIQITPSKTIGDVLYEVLLPVIRLRLLRRDRDFPIHAQMQERENLKTEGRVWSDFFFLDFFKNLVPMAPSHSCHAM